ncbi:PRP38 pre-mRNA processing factor 38 domain-containing protein B [Linnemannia elongata]|nr:PRP38 pre-mRNA processing factor 38 domain-containing protein B [Linnemannia elongata]
MSSNTLATHGNERTMNLNSVIFQNIIDSPYLKTIAELETFHEVQTEAQRNEPFLKGTTPSTAWVLMYKFWTLRLTVRQIESLIDNAHSVYLRGLGFLYLRFVCKPDQLWDWMGDYLEDDQEITLQAGPKPVYSTIGKMCYMLLHDQKFQGQMLPRIPVLVMRDLEQKLEPFADAGRAKTGQRDHFKTGITEVGMAVEVENAIATAVHRDTTGAGLDPDPDRGVVTVAEGAMTMMIAKVTDRAVITTAGAAAAAAIVGGTEEGMTTAVVAAAAAEAEALAGDRCIPRSSSMLIS